MADVRCPMCGKLNPPEREICQYCQARLKPAWGLSSAEKPPNPIDSSLNETPAENSDAIPHAELPDWLASLRQPDADLGDLADDLTSEWSHPVSSLQDETIPDWLMNIRQEIEPQTGEDQEQPEISESAEPDEMPVGDMEEPEWLKRIHTRQKKEAEQVFHPDNAETSSISDEIEPEEPVSEEQQPPLDAELPGWLADLSKPAQPGPGTQELLGQLSQPAQSEKDVSSSRTHLKLSLPPPPILRLRKRSRIGWQLFCKEQKGQKLKILRRLRKPQPHLMSQQPLMRAR
jgi:hypothetical protein